MINTVVFESPDMFTEFGGVSEFSVAKWKRCGFCILF